MINPQFSSGLATVLQRYVGMKRALGRQFDSATHALQSLDRLLVKEAYPDLNAAAFDAWCKTQISLPASAVFACLRCMPSASIGGEQSPSASCRIPDRFRHIIRGSGRTSSPNRRSRG
jgi:hypothetical protein